MEMLMDFNELWNFDKPCMSFVKLCQWPMNFKDDFWTSKMVCKLCQCLPLAPEGCWTLRIVCSDCQTLPLAPEGCWTLRIVCSDCQNFANNVGKPLNFIVKLLCQTLKLHHQNFTICCLQTCLLHSAWYMSHHHTGWRRHVQRQWMVKFDGEVQLKFRGFPVLLVKFDSQSALFSKFNSPLVPLANISKLYTPFLKSKGHLWSSSVIGNHTWSIKVSKFIEVHQHFCAFSKFNAKFDSFQSCSIHPWLVLQPQTGPTNTSRAVTTLSGH